MVTTTPGAAPAVPLPPEGPPHSESSYRAIFENAADGIWVHDVATGDPIEINPAAAAMFGYTREEMMSGGHEALLFPGTEYTAERVAHYIARAAAGEVPRFEWLGRHRDGSEVWAELTLRRVTVDGQDRILAIARDIGERKKAERALQEANAALEERVAERTAELAASNDALAREVEHHQAARNELTARTQQLETVFAALPDVFLRVAADGRILDRRGGESGFQCCLAIPADVHDVRDILPEEVQGEYFAAMGEVERTGELVCLEFEVTSPQLTGAEGSRVFEARLRPCMDGSTVTILRDITDRRASEEALRRSEEHFRALIENSSDYIMIVDPRGAITYVGPSVERILGYTPEEVLGDTPDAMVHPDDLPAVYEALGRVFAQPGSVVRTEFRIRHRDGSWRVMESFGRMLRPDTPEAGAVANGRDITDRRRAEDEVARQKAYFEEILESLDAGISVFDRDGRFEYTSASSIREPHIRRWVVGKTMADYGRARGLPEEVIASRQRSITEAIEARKPNQFEQEITTPDGRVRQMLRRLIPIVDEAGEVVRLVGYSIDITERKAAELALQVAKDEAERANRAKSEFLSRMSHELRTPLNAIIGFAQVLERKPLPPDQMGFVGHILKGGRHLLRLINEVLELSRIEAGRMSLSLEPIELNGVVREAIDLVHPLAAEGGNDLRFDPVDRSDVYALADRQRLSQILLNLLSNAIKYNRPGGPVEIGIDASDNGFAILIRDEGHGIDRERLDQLFTPFARLGAEFTETEGTGLGLALSRRLAEAMGGGLRLESTGPQGSTFRIDLRATHDPLIRARDAEVQVLGVDAEMRVAATILYIEDNLTNLSLVETVLEARPEWRTISALRGEDGIELAREEQPDLILLDLHLPDIHGDEVLARLRADEATRDIPVVVISADATGQSRSRMRAVGADEYLTKPLDLDDFVAAIERHLAPPG